MCSETGCVNEFFVLCSASRHEQFKMVSAAACRGVTRPDVQHCRIAARRCLLTYDRSKMSRPGHGHSARKQRGLRAVAQSRVKTHVAG